MITAKASAKYFPGVGQYLVTLDYKSGDCGREWTEQHWIKNRLTVIDYCAYQGAPTVQFVEQLSFEDLNDEK